MIKETLSASIHFTLVGFDNISLISFYEKKMNFDGMSAKIKCNIRWFVFAELEFLPSAESAVFLRQATDEYK